MTSFIKQEVHNLSLRRSRRTEQLPWVTCAKSLVKIGRVLPEICSQTDRQTDSQAHRHTVITILRSSIKGGVMGRLHDAAVAAIVGAIVGATRRTSVYKRQLSARLSAQLKAVAPIDRADSCMSVYVQNTLDKPDQTLSVGDPALRQSLLCSLWVCIVGPARLCCCSCRF